MTFTYPTAFSSWRPYDDSPEWSAYERVLRSGRLTMGPETDAFESEIAAYHGRRYAIATNSGSSANLIAVGALAHQRGGFRSGLSLETFGKGGARVVRVPAVAWSTTYAPLVQYGLDLAVIDVDDTWNANDSSSDDEMFIACSVLGNPIAPLPRYPDIEDNCESLGARTAQGRLTGTIGLLSTGSGFYSHQLSAVELGWVLTDDPELARLCRLLRNHGNSGWSRPELERRYDFTVFGYNVRSVEAHCAVAREQLKHLDEMVLNRRRNLHHFRERAINVKHQELSSLEPSPFGLAFEVETASLRSRLFAALAAEDIDSRLPTGGSFLKHAYALPWAQQSTPRADRIHERGMFLGNAPYPIPELIDRAVAVMRGVL